MEEAAQAWVALGEAREQARLDRCKIAAHFWGDRDVMSRFAALVEDLGEDVSEQGVQKYAGAGAVMNWGAPDGKAVEWYYQLSMWPVGMWETCLDWDALASLTSTQLRQLRLVNDKLRGVNKHLTIADGLADA